MRFDAPVVPAVLEIDIITIFPGMFRGPFEESIVRRAIDRGLVRVAVNDLRNHVDDRRRTVDDRPYGGGGGMVMMPDPIFRAVRSLRRPSSRVILLSPQGRRFDQETALALSREEHLLLLCGYYEGVDERVRQNLVSDEISIGDFVLTGGSLAAMVIVDAVTRLLPGAVGEPLSVANDSFTSGLLDYPSYTRPPDYEGRTVPEVLLSGDHESIRRWRRKEAFKRTVSRRPDLLRRYNLADDDSELLEQAKEELVLEKEGDD
ncbi:MAG: tRNA (guanosine(37)-N1)-methyltransferase TrmD [Candidatus Tritonobacter lacicola]|nr:tRNA (guanosine(37)-N1)-methyltransferase TrmD [Candidatus Tritonobacter lacicola]